MTRKGRYRWRTRLRRGLPWFLVDRGIAGKGTDGCGAHEWYNHDGVIARCYHCEVGERSWPVTSQDGTVSRG
jgi:hypothetical protein